MPEGEVQSVRHQIHFGSRKAWVIANFMQVLQARPGKWEPVSGQDAQPDATGGLRLHPLIAKLVDKDTLEKIGAKRTEGKK